MTVELIEYLLKKSEYIDFLRYHTHRHYYDEISEKYEILLTHLGFDIFDLFAAKHLKISDVNVIDDNIKNLINLETIDLSECGPTEMPTQIATMIWLKNIKLN
jgi:hypothetical protein